MVEPWSSKPLAWVRFLLLLITLVKHISTNVPRKRHKNYKGRKNSLYVGSKTSFFITNLASNVRRVGVANPIAGPRSLIIKLSYHNYRLSSSQKFKYLKSRVRRVSLKASLPHYRFTSPKPKRLFTMSHGLQSLTTVLGGNPFYGYTTQAPLFQSVLTELLTVTPYYSLSKSRNLTTFDCRRIKLSNGSSFVARSGTVKSELCSLSHSLSCGKGFTPTTPYVNSVKILRRYASILTFVKLINIPYLPSRLKKSRVTPYLGLRKGLFRGLQKALVSTTFSRFYNYRVRIQDATSSLQLVIRHHLTRNDNWFLYNNPTSNLWSGQPLTFSLLHSESGGVNLSYGAVWNSYLISSQHNTYTKRFEVNANSLATPFHPVLISRHQDAQGTIALLPSIQLNVRLFQRTLGSTLLYKYVTLLFRLTGNGYKLAVGDVEGPLLTFLKTHFFESRALLIGKTNLFPSDRLSYRIQARFTSLFLKNPFHVNVTMWYHTMLVRFIENCSGLKVSLAFNPFLENALTYTDIARCNSWTDRVFDFRRLLGPKVFIKESLKVFHLAFRLKDPAFLSSWIREMLKRTSFWKYRVLFRYVKYLVRHLLFTVFDDLQFKGFKLKLKGKISVGGNSRARTLMYRVGETSQSTFKNKVTHDLNFVYTFTGVMGFQLWFYF